VPLAAAFLAASAPALAASIGRAAESHGYAYTLDNDLERNEVVLERRADGSLAEMPGSPFYAGGKGITGGDIDEQGAIRVHGKFVLAVNAGSDSFAVLRKMKDGKLAHVPGYPFPSGGSAPLSLDVHGDLVYVASQAPAWARPTGMPNIVGFRLDGEGKLTRIPNSVRTFPAGQGPAEIEFAPHGRTVAVTSGRPVFAEPPPAVGGHWMRSGR
jgi:hypothetical protein